MSIINKIMQSNLALIATKGLHRLPKIGRTEHQRHSISKMLLILASLVMLMLGQAYGQQQTPWTSHVHDSSSSPQSNERVDSEVSSQVGQKQISAINLLLPLSTCPECRRVREEIFATNGCYQWENSHPEIIQMLDKKGNTLGNKTPAQKCFDKILLEPKTLKASSTLVWITARDQNSGQVLRCQVKVGNVARLAIMSNYKQFAVNNNKILNVVGYDKDGNIFSELDGFRLDWTIQDGKEVIKKIQTADPKMKSTHQTDVFFVRGIHEGTAKVGVRLLEPGYESVSEATIDLTVVNPIVLLPQEPVYILPSSEFMFSLAHIKTDLNGDIANDPIKIPHADFKWSVQRKEIGAIASDGKFTSNLIEGQTDILVEDKRLQNITNEAEGSINVVYPYKIEVRVSDVTNKEQLALLHPNDDAALMLGYSLGLELFDTVGKGEVAAQYDLQDTVILIEEHLYKIQMVLFDKEGHEITLTDNLLFESLNLDEKYVTVLKKNKIGSEIFIKTKTIPGEENLKLNTVHRLAEIQSKKGAKTTQFDMTRLAQEKDLIITKPVRIQHPTDSILLPFLPAGQEEHGSGEIWNLSAKGGSGVYHWSIIDPTVAEVKGACQVRSLKIGKTQLIVKDHKNFNNWDAIDIEVAQLHQLAWIEEQSEMKAVIGDPKKVSGFAPGDSKVLSLVALDNIGRKFTNCTSVRPTFKILEEGLISLSEIDNGEQNKYESIMSYARGQENKDLLLLRQMFDEQTNAVFGEDLQREGAPNISEELMFYNNFGICAQQVIKAGKNRGLAHLKASLTVYDQINGPSRILESEHAEIAVFYPLVSKAPVQQQFLQDMYSLNQLGQEFTTFEQFYQRNIFHLQYGTSVQWTINGGTNFWQEYEGTYQSNSIIKPHKDEKSISVSVEKLKEKTNQFTFSVSCGAPNEVKQLTEAQKVSLQIDQHSRQTRRLMRPVNHKIEVEVSCEPPRNLRLLWAQKDRLDAQNRTDLPKSRVIQNERSHFVLVNSHHYVRYLMLDDLYQVSLNHSSVLTNITVTDPSIAQVSLMPSASGNYFRDSNNDVSIETYDKRLVSFFNVTGTVEIIATAQHYLGQMLDLHEESKTKHATKGGLASLFGGSTPSETNRKASDVANSEFAQSLSGDALKFTDKPITDKLKVEVVRNVDVTPKYKSLYIGASPQTYKLRILHGSGQFSVTLNNTMLADITQTDRTILITPKGLGGLKIKVQDLEIPSSQVATAEILISDIARLSLWAPRTLIEQGDQMELVVSAFDQFGVEFDKDQYDLMNFDIETEMTGILRTQGLQTVPVKGNNRNFIAHGKEQGIYQSIAYVLKFPFLRSAMASSEAPLSRDQTETFGNKHTVVSEMLRIEVFPLLEILPNNLLITPNMKYTLQIVGGPQTTRAQRADGSHIEIKFEIEGSDIASVDQFREVTGHKVGDAVLKYEIIQLRTQQISPQNLSPYEAAQAPATQRQVSRVVSGKTVPIRVRLVTDIEIPNAHRRQIYSHSLIKMGVVLKYNDEYFHHGIAPISYHWDCSHERILDLQIPTKQELAASHGVTPNNILMTSRYVRDNLQNNDAATFFSSFNSSSIYAEAAHEGDAIVSVRLAIDYPEFHNKDQNWFSTSVQIRVVQRLVVNVPAYSKHDPQQTHLYLLPPNTLTKIETNKGTRLRLGYSEQSAYDYSTQGQHSQEAQTPTIQLVNDEAIRTFDKYGKVTVILEEGQAFSDQVVMLNVLIADIFSISTMESYDALSLPLGSSLKLPVHFQNEHAHRFAEHIQGLPVGVILSHPRVVSVKLDNFNQTVTIVSEGSGDCNIVIYLEDHPHIFDVIRVRVSSIVQPPSPVELHVGGEVEFRIESLEARAGGVRWSSSDHSTLQIDQATGKAVGLREGKAEVLLSDHANAASLVHVSRVGYAQLDQQSSLLINTDAKSITGTPPEHRVRVRFFLEGTTEEVMPIVQFHGITLIKQHIGIDCVSSNPEFIEAYGEVEDLEGFFCVMKFVKDKSGKPLPKYVKITASAYAISPIDKKQIYKRNVTEFDVQLDGEIQVESAFRNGVHLYSNQRKKDIRVFSSSDFDVRFDYGTPEEGEYVRKQVQAVSPNSNEYILTVQVPIQVSHQFNARIILSHGFAQKPNVIPLTFTPSDAPGTKIRTPVREEVEVVKAEPTVSSRTENNVQYQQEEKQTTWSSFFTMLFAVICVCLFLLNKCCQVDIQDVYDYFTRRSQARSHQGIGSHVHSFTSADSIRESKAWHKKRSLASFESGYGNPPSYGHSLNDSRDPRRSRPSVLEQRQRQVGPLNLDRHGNSIYSNIQDSTRHY